MFGPRQCPGKILALLELKVMLISLLLKVDWEIEEKDLKNEDLFFTLMSPHELHLKVKNN